jgi:hypothetical protein
VNGQGRSPTTSFFQKACPNLPGVNGPPPVSRGGGGHDAVSSGGQQAFQQCITAISAKYHQVVTYQPANRFWPFQAYETLLFVVLAAALAGVSVWWLRHRVR